MGSAFPPDRMAECNIPYIEEIAGELIISCDICNTEPQPLFNPNIPLPPPPSFDFGCYPMTKPDYDVITPRGNVASASGNSYFIDPSIVYQDFLNVGYCKPQINIDMRFPTTKSHEWDACDVGNWPFNYGGQDIDPFTGDPIAEADKYIDFCCNYDDADCLHSVVTEEHGAIDQWSNAGCDELHVMVANRTAYVHKEEDPGGGSEDWHMESGYVPIQFPVCDVQFDFVCDVYCDESELNVAFRRAHFKRGILVKLEDYDVNRDFEEDTINVSCGQPPPCPDIPV